MERLINIDGQGVRMDMSADTLRVYRQTFGRDLLFDMAKLRDGVDLEVLENLAYVAAAACQELPPIDEWLRGFTPLAIYDSSDEILNLWLGNEQTTTTRKKKADQ